MAQQKTTIKINKKYNPREREAIGKEIVNHIIKRTLSGKDVNNRNFTGYSKSYKKSLEFKIAGKSSNKVNLRLSGEMLNELKVLKNRSGEITIGYESGSEENDKAEGNQKGTYGNPRPVTKPRRFIGISGNDLRKNILSKYPLTNKDKRLKRLVTVEKISEGVREELDGVETTIERNRKRNR